MMDLFTAADARDAGMSRAANAEASVNPDFGSAAYAAICRIARAQREVHVDDVLRQCSLTPAHPNAWGSVWMRAIRDGVISRTGTIRPCLADPLKHKHNYPVYRSNLA